MSSDVMLLAKRVETLIGSAPSTQCRIGYQHMGATICDAVLQAGLNYRHVVAPRVERVLRFWPRAVTTSVFFRKLNTYGAGDVLNWRDPIKLHRVAAMTEFLLDLGLENEDALRIYLTQPQAAESLMQLSGVGPKTVDYLKVMVALPTLAIDRHLRAVVAEAGIRVTSYAEVQQLFLAAAEILGVDPAVLDQALWSAKAVGATDFVSA